MTVAVACGLSPGLADVLVRHASASFEKVEEIRVARTGWAGPASVETVRHERRMPVHKWHEGRWREDHPHGDILVWFPEPIGGRDCRPVTGGTALLIDAFPSVPRVSVQLGEPPKRGRFRRQFGDEGEWGATRVDVWGRRDGIVDCLVYGVVERTAVAAGHGAGRDDGAAGGQPDTADRPAWCPWPRRADRARTVPGRAGPAGRPGGDVRGRRGRVTQFQSAGPRDGRLAADENRMSDTSMPDPEAPAELVDLDRAPSKCRR